MQTIAMKTNTDLLAALKQAVKNKPSRAQIEKQRVSFVYSIMSGAPNITREKVEELVEQQTGR